MSKAILPVSVVSSVNTPAVNEVNLWVMATYVGTDK